MVIYIRRIKSVLEKQYKNFSGVHSARNSYVHVCCFERIRKMRYKTVKEVIDFVSDLRGKELHDFALEILMEFYLDGGFVGRVIRDMWDGSIEISLDVDRLNKYGVESFSVEEEGNLVVFKFRAVKPSSI